MALELEVTGLVEGKRLSLRPQRPTDRPQEVEIQLESTGRGCRVSLRIDGPMSVDEREGTCAGWHTQLRILDRFLSLQDPGPRQSFAILGPSVTTLERVFEHFIRPNAWLAGTETLSLGDEGQAYALTTPEGIALSGDVLSRAKRRELALWCSEIRGVLRMRALPLGGGIARLVGVQLSCWSDDARVEPLVASLQASVDRLLAMLGGPLGHA